MPFPETLSVSPQVRQALLDARQRLRELYGDRLSRLVLYGSQARGDARPDSDVDLMVVLKGEVAPAEEASRTSRLTIQIAAEHGVWLSLFHVSDKEFASGRPLFASVRGEGVDL